MSQRLPLTRAFEGFFFFSVVLSFRFCTSFFILVKNSSRDAIDLSRLSRRVLTLSSFPNLCNIISTFFPSLSAIDSAVSSSSSVSPSLVNRLASLLFSLRAKRRPRKTMWVCLSCSEASNCKDQQAKWRSTKNNFSYTLTVPSLSS